MLEAARSAGTVAAVNFNYRKAPAVALAKRLVEEGRIGEVRHWRAVYLQDWILDPQFPLIWRLQKDKAGSGALGDIGAHIVDLAHHLVGPIASVVGTTETFIKERPLEETSDGLSATGGAETGPVTVDDAAVFLARFENGATGAFEASRLAPGRKNKNSFEINGSEGSIVFDLERMNELQVCFADDPPEVGGFRTVMVTEPEHPYMEAWWPPGHILGYEHTFVHAVRDLLDGMGTGRGDFPTFEDGFRCQAVLDAVERSADVRGGDPGGRPLLGGGTVGRTALAASAALSVHTGGEPEEMAAGREAPRGPRGGLFLGNVRDFQRDKLGFVEGVARRYGDVVRSRMANMTWYQVNPPEGVTRVLRDNNRHYGKGSLTSGALGSCSGRDSPPARAVSGSGRGV